MSEEKFRLVKEKLNKSYTTLKNEKDSKKIVLIKNNRVFPTKNEKIQKIVDTLHDYFLKDLLQEDYSKYTKSIENSDMTTVKYISKKYKMDLGRLNGYDMYICDTENEYLKYIFAKVFRLY